MTFQHTPLAPCPRRGRFAFVPRQAAPYSAARPRSEQAWINLSVNRGTNHQAEAIIEGAEVRGVEVASANAKVVGVVVDPRPTAEHPI